MADNGIFDIFTVSNLFRKLRHDYQRVSADPADRWAAIDFVLTADSLRHWAIHDKSCGATAHITVVQICRELANRSKHWQAGSVVVKESKAIDSGFQFDAFGPGFQRGILAVALDGNAEKEFGPEIGFEDLARRTFEFWTAELESGSSSTS